MKRAVVAGLIQSRLSDEALALINQWNIALGEIDDEPLIEAVADFGTVLARNLEARAEAASTKVRPTQGRWVLLIDFPPYTELAMREVIAAIRSVGGLSRRIAIVQAMTKLLLGRGCGVVH
jgi:hypothetical protein